MPENEFAIIEDLFAPLAKGAAGAFGLKDDAALLEASEYVVTKDILIAGVHFRDKDPLDLVAQKLLRVNLSDLAAKGARPVGYFLGCSWPKITKRKDIAAFVDGLAQDQAAFRIDLFGGDTTVHTQDKAPLVLSATMFGTPPRHGVVPRSKAQAGDDLYVTGTIGDAGLGLKCLDGSEKFPRAHKSFLTERYQTPSPRLTLGGALTGLASAAIDVSDGLAADCGHLLTASGDELGAIIRAEMIPLSEAGEDWLQRQDSTDAAYCELASAGDDYEILFTAPPSRRRSVEMAANVAKTPVARIGTILRGEGPDVSLINADGAAIPLKKRGFNHFK